MGLLNILYDSEHFYVAEFSSNTGVELVDKQTARSGYLEGAVAERLRACMARIRTDEQGEDAMDEFLGTYDALLTHSLRLH
jgi:hypothetical protein